MNKQLTAQPELTPWSFRQKLERIRYQIRHPHSYRQMLNRCAHYSCIFCHIPKSAGRSVRESLFNGPGAHRTLASYQTMLPPELFAACFKFTFVRNPWDRLVSAFFYLKNKDMRSNQRWARAHLSRFNDFNTFVTRWVNTRNIWSYVFFRPQHHFICLQEKLPAVDFIGLYENLLPDFDFVCKRINSSATLQEKNRNSLRDKDFREYYTNETRDIVAEVYADDIDLFGYSFDNSSLPDQIAARDQAPVFA